MGRTIRTWLIALVAFAAFAVPAVAQESGGWWNKEWPYRRAVTIDTTPAGVNLAGAIGRAPVLVRLHSGNFAFSDSLENGADLRVVDSDGKTPLTFHIERYDAANQIAVLWVAVPNLAGGEQRRLWIYYGNQNAPSGSDVARTYDADTVAAYHFSESRGTPAKDLTANKNDAANAAPAIDENGIIARAAQFPGQGALTIPATPSLAMPAGAPMTIELWVRPRQPAGDQAVFARGALTIGLAGGLPFVQIGEQRLQGSAALAADQWAKLAFTSDGQALRLYADGVEVAAATATLPALDGPIALGGTAERPFAGDIDEVRLSKTARPAAMLRATANAEGPSNKLVGVGETAERQSEGGGTFFFVLSKVESVDAAIIALCMIILALAIAVIVAKTRYLNRAQRANAAFLRRFRQMREDLVSVRELRDVNPAELAAIERAPLAHLFETGMEELRLRQTARGRHAFTGESVEAMRAAVDAVVVEENQKLDRFMVLLTIAISGGPFIGLLGTVLGVMNTFAGVALAGDVNVNAIAPGIAAALMATIAGLACAIPSLFGYNYLNTRISALSDEMRVFVDRLITRLAEVQAGSTPSPTPAPSLQAAE